MCGEDEERRNIISIARALLDVIMNPPWYDRGRRIHTVADFLLLISVLCPHVLGGLITWAALSAGPANDNYTNIQ